MATRKGSDGRCTSPAHEVIRVHCVGGLDEGPVEEQGEDGQKERYASGTETN